MAAPRRTRRGNAGTSPRRTTRRTTQSRRSGLARGAAALAAAVLCFLGYHDEKDGTTFPLHTKDFCVNDDILDKGSALFAQFATDFLKGEKA